MKVSFINCIKIKEEKFPYGNYYKFNFSPLIQSSNIDNNIIIYSIRYSKLLEFHSNLLNQYKKIHLPNFPEKILFHQEKYILKRAYDLENYINKLLYHHNDKINREMKFFLNSNIQLEHNKLSDLSINTSISTLSSITDNINNNHVNVNENKIENFLKTLSNAKSDFSNIIDNFIKKNNIFTVKNNFTKIDIYKLFFGENNQLNGLIYYINNIRATNLLGSINCLIFISKLIDCECNNDYEIYREIFKLITIHNLRNLNLEAFLELNNFNIIDRVFVIIRCICQETEYSFYDCIKGNFIKKYYNWYNDWLD